MPVYRQSLLALVALDLEHCRSDLLRWIFLYHWTLRTAVLPQLLHYLIAVALIDDD